MSKLVLSNRPRINPTSIKMLYGQIVGFDFKDEQWLTDDLCVGKKKKFSFSNDQTSWPKQPSEICMIHLHRTYIIQMHKFRTCHDLMPWLPCAKSDFGQRWNMKLQPRNWTLSCIEALFVSTYKKLVLIQINQLIYWDLNLTNQIPINQPNGR